jgi:hypothetical protein
MFVKIICNYIKDVGVSYMDLANWVNSHRDIPEDDNVPFVIKSQMAINNLVLEASTIRISLSTKALLRNLTKTKHLCADATYKLIWHSMLLI